MKKALQIMYNWLDRKVRSRDTCLRKSVSSSYFQMQQEIFWEMETGSISLLIRQVLRRMWPYQNKIMQMLDQNDEGRWAVLKCSRHAGSFNLIGNCAYLTKLDHFYSNKTKLFYKMYNIRLLTGVKFRFLTF